MMARLIQEKGIREYAQATRQLKSQSSQIICQLLGAPELHHKRAISLDEIEESGIEYLGETADVKPFIENAHVIVLPSYREGLPKSLLEAAAMKKPIIACDVPGCKRGCKRSN